MPAGLPNSVAILARTLLSPMPTEQCSRVSRRTASCARRASASGSSVRAPRNASSHPSTSTTTPSDRSVAITWSEAASYAGRVDGQEHRVGQLAGRDPQRQSRSARRTRAPRRTPSRRRRARSGRRGRRRRPACRPAPGGAAPRRPRRTGRGRRAAPRPWGRPCPESARSGPGRSLTGSMAPGRHCEAPAGPGRDAGRRTDPVPPASADPEVQVAAEVLSSDDTGRPRPARDAGRVDRHRPVPAAGLGGSVPVAERHRTAVRVDHRVPPLGDGPGVRLPRRGVLLRPGRPRHPVAHDQGRVPAGRPVRHPDGPRDRCCTGTSSPTGTPRSGCGSCCTSRRRSSSRGSGGGTGVTTSRRRPGTCGSRPGRGGRSRAVGGLALVTGLFLFVVPRRPSRSGRGR